MNGPCAKVQIMAVLRTLDGQRFVGENLVANPQATCPRYEPPNLYKREDYRLCDEVCQSGGHAEAQAVMEARLAGAHIHGGHMTVFHKRVCSACQEMLEADGITWECVLL